jgi:hypothetical protein
LIILVSAATSSTCAGGAPHRDWAWALRLAVPIALVWIAGCGKSPTTPSDARTFVFDFARTDEGWTADVADYTIERKDAIDFIAEHRPLPSPLDRTRGGLFTAGDNPFDDLFMFWKGRVAGLRPDRTYTVEFTIEFATNVPKTVGGIGGSPDTSVFVKVGASDIEPASMAGPIGSCPSFRYCLNIDKGNQSQSGADAIVIGTAGNLSGTETWELKELRSGPTRLAVTPNADGSVWLLVGTDSGFEGRTSLYYTRVVAQFGPR